MNLVLARAGAAIVKVGGCRVGGIYGKCGVWVHDMRGWLDTLAMWIERGDWVLLGDWNTHHHTWSLYEKSGPGGGVLAEWVQERGAEVHFGKGGTFECRRVGGVVQSRRDCVVSSPGCGWVGAADDWLLSDHASISGPLVVGEVDRVDERVVIDWDRLAKTLQNEDVGWYDGLKGDKSYDYLLDLRSGHLKRLWVC